MTSLELLSSFSMAVQKAENAQVHQDQGAHTHSLTLDIQNGRASDLGIPDDARRHRTQLTRPAILPLFGFALQSIMSPRAQRTCACPHHTAGDQAGGQQCHVSGRVGGPYIFVELGLTDVYLCAEVSFTCPCDPGIRELTSSVCIRLDTIRLLIADLHPSQSLPPRPRVQSRALACLRLLHRLRRHLSSEIPHRNLQDLSFCSPLDPQVFRMPHLV